MVIFEMLTHAGIIALLSMFMGLAPMGMGIAYAIRPSETRLAFMRPLSLAGIFSGVTGSIAGLANVFQFMARAEQPVVTTQVALGLSEALIPMFVGFGCLTVAWLCVAIGLARHP